MQDVDYKSVGKRIRESRRQHDWTQGELAEKCGVSMSFIGHIERGTRIMSLDTFAAICDVLDVGADELLWGKADDSGSNTRRNSHLGLDKQRLDKPGLENDKNYELYVRIMESVAEVMGRA